MKIILWIDNVFDTFLEWDKMSNSNLCKIEIINIKKQVQLDIYNIFLYENREMNQKSFRNESSVINQGQDILYLNC